MGLVVGEKVHALPAGSTLLEMISRGPDALAEFGQQAERAPAAVVNLEDATLAAPIPVPPSIRDCLCFLDHLRNCQQALGLGRELKDVWYWVPAFYFACPSTVLGPHDDVPIAPGSAWQDFELEIGAIIGGAGANLSVADAERLIVGYTIFNDWSARDLQMFDTQLGIGQAKGKDSAVTLGPALVTPDELEPFVADGRLNLRVSASVNGSVIGTGSTGSMDWSFPEVISYASRGVTLKPGDVFGSGTIPTCTLVEHLDINDMNAFRGWLQAGDEVTIEVEGLGRIRQTLRPSAPVQPLRPRRNPEAAVTPPRKNRAPAVVPYSRGLHMVADRIWAWTLPDGGFGWSNAGLVGGEGATLLVDTLFDLDLTREMLTAMQPITDDCPIQYALLTHSNGDHAHGNCLLGSAVQIIAAKATAEELTHNVAPETFTLLQHADLGPTSTPYVRERFAPFNFAGITQRNADLTFEEDLSIEVGGRQINIYNLGPAHTAADSVVHIPDAGVLFGGDLLFFGCTPIIWSGPISNWTAACDAMSALDPSIVVPGHGPVGDAHGIRRVRDYLAFVTEQADAAYRTGQGFREAADRIDLGEFGDWLDAERIVVNIYQRYRELDSETPQLSNIELLTLQADWHANRFGQK